MYVSLRYHHIWVYVCISVVLWYHHIHAHVHVGVVIQYFYMCAHVLICVVIWYIDIKLSLKNVEKDIRGINQEAVNANANLTLKMLFS